MVGGFQHGFEDRFCTSQKSGIGGGEWVSAGDAMHM